MSVPTGLRCRHTLLVVDDEEPLRRYLANLLQGEGYHVISAANGVEALTVLEGSRVQLVITDVMMPCMSGPELAARLGERPDGPPVLFMSAHYTGPALPGPLLVKPFLPADLSLLVERLLATPQVPRLISSGVS